MDPDVGRNRGSALPVPQTGRHPARIMLDQKLRGRPDRARKDATYKQPAGSLS